MFWIIPVALLILFELIADFFSEKYALSGARHFWVLALAMYIVANIFWLWGIRSGSGLARGAIIFSVGSALVAAILGIYYFHESTSFLQYVGIVLAIIALVCILWK